MRNIEALEVFFASKKIKNPQRTYLKTFFDESDWFRLVLLGQYLNYPLTSFVKICQENLREKSLGNNLIRAILFDVSSKSQCKFSKKRKPKSVENQNSQLFSNGKFHDFFAILLKCDENVSHLEISFDDLQKREITQKNLLNQAMIHDFPVLAVLAAMTKQYEINVCRLTWIVLSSDFQWLEKFKNFTEFFTKIVHHCIENKFISTLDNSFAIFSPRNSNEISHENSST